MTFGDATYGIFNALNSDSTLNALVGNNIFVTNRSVNSVNPSINILMRPRPESNQQGKMGRWDVQINLYIDNTGSMLAPSGTADNIESRIDTLLNGVSLADRGSIRYARVIRSNEKSFEIPSDDSSRDERVRVIRYSITLVED